MGAIFADGIQVGDDGRLAYGHFDAKAWQAEEDDRSARVRRVMDDTIADIERVGRAVRRKLVRNAFERYRRQPWLLDNIALGLSTAHPAFIIATVEQKARITWGRIDMLGVLPVNLAAAVLYARWLRLEMRREQGVAA